MLQFFFSFFSIIFASGDDPSGAHRGRFFLANASARRMYLLVETQSNPSTDRYQACMRRATNK